MATIPTNRARLRLPGLPGPLASLFQIVKNTIGFPQIGFVSTRPHVQPRPCRLRPQLGSFHILLRPLRAPHVILKSTPMQQEVVEAQGHLIDSHLMEQIFDTVVEYNGRFEVEEFRIGRTNAEPSYLRLKLQTEQAPDMQQLLSQLLDFGCSPVDSGDVELAAVERDCCAPAGGAVRWRVPANTFRSRERKDKCGTTHCRSRSVPCPPTRKKDLPPVFLPSWGFLGSAFNRYEPARLCLCNVKPT